MKNGEIDVFTVGELIKELNEILETTDCTEETEVVIIEDCGIGALTGVFYSRGELCLGSE